MNKLSESITSGKLDENGKGRRSIIRGIIGTLLAVPACTSLLESQIYEFNRAKNTESLTSEQLGLVKDKTKILEAFRKMNELDLTGIVKDDCGLDDGSLLQALAADYQKQVHIFRDNRYFQSVELHSGEMETHGFGIGMGTDGETTALFAAYRDKNRIIQPRVDTFLSQDSSFVYKGSLQLGEKAKKEGGFALPHFVGHDLKSGMLLLGRNDSGGVWKKIPRIRIIDGKLEIDEVSLNYAARCGCTMDYIKGDNIGLGEISEDSFSRPVEE